MPELPEVQTVVDQLNQHHLPGRTIVDAAVYWPKTIAGMAPALFCQQVTGCAVKTVSRRGKYIVLQLTDNWHLLIHLRMSGRLTWKAAGEPRNRHEHVVFRLEDNQDLRFQDTRKFGRIFLTATPETILDRLGPEPLGRNFTRERFAAMLEGRNRQLKPLLLDQAFVAGLGNIYVDEALWQAGIHPLRAASSLTEAEVIALHAAIPAVLHQGLRNRGTSLGSGKGNFHAPGKRPGRNAEELMVFRRTDTPCPRCQTLIQRIVVGQRSSHICPACQPAP